MRWDEIRIFFFFFSLLFVEVVVKILHVYFKDAECLIIVIF